jgi:hypothetical protein
MDNLEMDEMTMDRNNVVPPSIQIDDDKDEICFDFPRKYKYMLITVFIILLILVLAAVSYAGYMMATYKG